MKNTNLFPIFIWLLFVVIMTSCEKTEIQKTTSIEEVLIAPRTDCQYCPDSPVEHCCCSIEVLTMSTIAFEFCGTSGSKESITACGPITGVGCSGDIEGYTWTIQLNQNDKQSFCMEPGTAFMLKVTNGNGFIRITCQEGETAPQNVIIPVSFPNKYYFDVNGVCEVIEC
jgi:hypothetical protein